MPTSEIIDGRTIIMYSDAERAEGVTKARIADNITRVPTGNLHSDDAAYVAFVCAGAGLETLPDYAADSYAAQHAGVTIAELEAELADALTPEPQPPEPQP